MKIKAILFTVLVSMLMTLSVVAVTAVDPGEQKDPEKIINLDSDARTLEAQTIYGLMTKIKGFYKSKMKGDLDDAEKKKEKEDEKRYKKKPGTRDRLRSGGIFYNETSSMYQVDVWGNRKLVEQKMQTAGMSGQVDGTVAVHYDY